LRPAPAGCYSIHMTNQEISRQDQILAAVAVVMNTPAPLRNNARHSVRMLLNDEGMYSIVLDELDALGM
jgi:hypothetical protein